MLWALKWRHKTISQKLKKYAWNNFICIIYEQCIVTCESARPKSSVTTDLTLIGILQEALSTVIFIVIRVA